jgi:hypothetical protein
MEELLHTVRSRDVTIGPLPLAEIKEKLRARPVSRSAMVTIHTRLGDKYSPISHLPELAEYTISSEYAQRIAQENLEIHGPQPHKPNHIPVKERFGCCVLILLYFFLCYLGFVEGKVYIPGGRNSPGWYISGQVGFWAAELSHLCIIASCATILVDHFDKRANEVSYKLWNRCFVITAVALGLIAFTVGKVERRIRTANQASQHNAIAHPISVFESRSSRR